MLRRIITMTAERSNPLLRLRVLQPNHQNQRSAVKHLPNIGRDAAGQTHESQCFWHKNHECRRREAAPQISHAANDDQEEENGFVDGEAGRVDVRDVVGVERARRCGVDFFNKAWKLRGMSDSLWDVIVIGGGPGGSAAATFLSKSGRRVLMLEKEFFPRFHIGESLLPYNQRIFAAMGVLPALEAHGFVRKLGAQFHLGNGSQSTCFVFGNGKFTKFPEAIQVERATFDHILLKHARYSGAEVREGWTVSRFASGTNSIEITAVDPDGKTHRLSGRFLIDASGRGNLTGNQEGIREVHPRLKKVAVFGHFHGVRRDQGSKSGDTVIVRLENKWFWLIPISVEKVSVGCVMDRDEFATAGASPEDVFHHWVDSSPPMRERMKAAIPVGPIQTTSDFSYRNRCLVGPRLLRVGDAAGFIDPIFSAGVYLAMNSGKLAADAVNASLAAHDNYESRFQHYEKRIRFAMETYLEMVEHFYTTPFMEVFLNPYNSRYLPAGINAILAGELEGRWAMRWRLRLFLWIVRIQARWPVMPRLCFAPISDVVAINYQTDPMPVAKTL